MLSALEDVLRRSKSLNIDECEAIGSQRKVTTVRITDSDIAEVKQNNENVLAVRAVYQKRISTAQTSIIDDAAQTVDRAMELSKFHKPKEYWKSLPHTSKKSYLPVDKTFDKKLEEISGHGAIDISQAMINSASKPGVSSLSGSLNIVSEKFHIVNTNGLCCSDEATYVSGTINADSTAGNCPVSGIGQASARTLDGFCAESIGESASQMCVESINPQTCEQDTYSIIFEPYSVGEMLAFVFSSNFNLKTYSEKQSCFSDKELNQKIAADGLNMIDDPHAPQGVGSKAFDDEGTATKPSSLIKDGTFYSTYSNLFDAFKEGTESSGNAARPGSPMGRSAEPIPVSAPHNLKITGTDTMSKDEIIQDTQHGLLVGRLWYTYAVNPTKGDFSCTARSGVRIIENGEIKAPGKSVRIVHNLPVLLQNVSAIGDDAKNVLQWASLPSITPSIRVEGVCAVPI